MMIYIYVGVKCIFHKIITIIDLSTSTTVTMFKFTQSLYSNSTNNIYSITLPFSSILGVWLLIHLDLSYGKPSNVNCDQFT